jgi:hypothetical protein
MKSRSRLVWLAALALILAVPPIASSVGGSSEQKQNARLDRHSKRLGQHGRQLRRLSRVDVGVARGYMLTDQERMEAIKGATVVSSPLSQTARVPAMGTLTFPILAGPHDRGVRVRGAMRSSALAGGKKGAAIGAGGAGLYIVCAPMGGSTCAGGTVSAGETVCSISHGYDSGTGVLTLVDIPRSTSLSDTASPKPGDVDIARGTCELPGPGRYNGFLSHHFEQEGPG